MSSEILKYIDAPTQYIDVEGISYAYRSRGRQAGTPLVCLQHFTGTLDNWDPAVTNGLAQTRPVITIDNAGIGHLVISSIVQKSPRAEKD